MSSGECEALFQPDLLKDEKILWSGRPEVSADLTDNDMILIPVTLCWGGFMFFWLGEVISSFLSHADGDGVGFADIMFLAVGILFNIAGVYLIIGRFIYKRWRKRQTFYALTDCRALILKLSSGRKIEAVFFDRMTSIYKSLRSDGIGTVHFGNSYGIGALQGNTGLDIFPWSFQRDAPAFYDIRDVDEVYDLANTQRYLTPTAGRYTSEVGVRS